MAYMGRGGFSSSGGNFNGGTNSNNNFNNNGNNNNNNMQNRNENDYRYSMFRVYTYVPVDNTYVIIEMIAAIIIAIVAGLAFVFTYKSPIEDPILHTKKVFMNTYLITILVLMGLVILANLFSKDKDSLIERLIAILAISIIVILCCVGIKVKLDSIYVSSKFEEIYDQTYGNKNSSKTRIDIGLGGMDIKSEREYYVEKCVESYRVFSARMYGVICINLFIIVLLVYQIYKVFNLEEKKNKLTKDDAVLFDDEENVKF